MAIAFVSSGVFASSTAPVNECLTPYPAGLAYGDLILLFVSNKYPNNAPDTPLGWTSPVNGRGSGGAGIAGIDSGTVYSSVFVRQASGNEAGDVNVVVPSGNVVCARMFAYRKSSSMEWGYACTFGADNVAGLAWSVTGSANPGISAGDVVVVGSAWNGDAASFSAEALAAAGCSFSAAVERGDNVTGTGDDAGLFVSEHACTAGPSSAAPVFTATASGTAGNYPAGASVFVRLRESIPSYSKTPRYIGGSRGPRRPVVR